MDGKELSEKIRRRIEKSKREYNRKAQNAVLLLRNEIFLRELRRLPEKKSFCRRWKIEYAWDGEIGSLSKYAQKAESLIKNGIFMNDFRAGHSDGMLAGAFFEGSPKWENLCRRWHINTLWNGQDDALMKYIDDPIVVLYRDNKTGEERMLNIQAPISSQGDPYGEIWSSRVDKERDYIYLKIEPWTRKKDIEKIWSQIEELKKRIFYYSERDKKLFGRDLCWYDLNKNEEFRKQSSGKISILWRKYLNGDTISRDTIKDAVRRIQKYIDRLTPPSV